MEDSEIDGIVRELGSPESGGAWTAFLGRFSPLFLQKAGCDDCHTQS
jgi:hypothetical protein